MADAHYPIRIDPRFRWLIRLWGVTPERAYVDVSDELDARFGRFRFRVPIADIVRWRIEGPFRWITALGVRRSIRGGDVTFGGSAHGGVRVDFRTPVRWGRLHVPALYLTADDLEGLAAELERRGIPGSDARRDPSAAR
jgi:hypothetical protein